MNKAKYYIEELNAIDEHVKIEAKQCSDKIDKSVLETICSFSNEPELDGGVIIIGLHESEDSDARYSVVGVNDADKLQKDLATQCANMFNHPVRPLIEVDVVDGQKVLIIEVQELDAKYKPLYFKDAGLPKGAWRRIGSTDHRCTEEDLHILFHEADDFDTAIAKRTDLDDLDENAVSTYRRLRAAINPKAEELNYSDKDLLRSLNCIEKDKDGEWKLTNTGLLVFGKSMALRRELPAVRVDYIRVTGTEWLPDPHNRFESIDMRGPLLLMVNRAFNAIADDLPRGFSLSPGNLQANRPLPIPDEALREAIVNSLIHQNFRIHQPIQIIRYSNRIEIINPGFSLKPAETLGEPGSRLRNPTISSIFHETQLAEAKGTGIGTMRRLMKEAAMVPPTFESDYSKNTFTTRILLHHFLSESDLAWFDAIKADKLCDAQKVALVFVREVGAIDNITYRQLSGTSAKDAKKELKTLVNLEFIKSKGQGRKTYYIPTERFKSLCTNGVTSDGKVTTSDGKVTTSDGKVTTSDGKVTTSDGKVTTSDGKVTTSDGKVTTSGGKVTTSDEVFSENVLQKIKSLGKRSKKSDLENLIAEMCQQSPLSIEEIAEYTKRTISYIRIKILPTLLREKRIKFLIPEMINHPNQKYTATK
jgi:ATP-dependent DNA helicase RecG